VVRYCVVRHCVVRHCQSGIESLHLSEKRVKFFAQTGVLFLVGSLTLKAKINLA
jgi:hypothetical protein